MKRYGTLLVCVILVLSIVSAAGVVTAATARAESSTSYTIPVDGQPHTYTQMNYQESSTSGFPVVAAGNTLTVNTITPDSGGTNIFNEYGATLAGVGINWQLDPNGYTDAELAQTTATVTVKGSWSIDFTHVGGEASMGMGVYLDMASGSTSINHMTLYPYQGTQGWSGTGTIDTTITNYYGYENTPLSLSLLSGNPLNARLIVQMINDGQVDVEINVIIDSIEVTFTPPAHQNDPPTAVIAGSSEQSTTVKSVFQLDGSQSSDSNGDAISYAWTVTAQPHGSKAQLSDATAAQPTVKFGKAGTYTFQLVVTDEHGLQSSDTVTVIVSKK